MNQPPENRIRRYAKGKRPKFYNVEGLDEAMSMILVLASEFSVMRDRLDSFEIIAAKKGLILGDEIDKFEPDEATIALRDARRKALLDRLYYLTLKKADEEKNDDTEERYHGILDEIARD